MSRENKIASKLFQIVTHRVDSVIERKHLSSLGPKIMHLFI